MHSTTALILDKGDYTRDGNIRQDAFLAICAHDVVISGNTIVKCQRPISEPEVVQTPLPMSITPPAPRASSTDPSMETPQPGPIDAGEATA